MTLSAIPDIAIKPWLRGSLRSYLFTNANVIDVTDGSVRKGAAVSVKRGKFTAIEDTSKFSAADAAAEGVTVIDVEGGYLCPGLIDSHVHISSTAGTTDVVGSLGGENTFLSCDSHMCGSQMLYRGFTTVRDCGGATLALKEAIADGVFPGPRIFFAGRALSQTGGHGDIRGRHDHTPLIGTNIEASCCGGAHALQIGCVVNGAPECMGATREMIRTGSDFIKIMGSGGVASPSDQISHVQFTPEEIRAIVACATNAGTYVTAHAYTPASIRQCVDNGVMGIEHGNLLDAPTAALMAKKGAYLTPTLVTYNQMASGPWSSFMPPDNAAKNQEVLQKGLDALQIAEEAGVTICFGTDLLGPLGAAQSKEFRIRAAIQKPLSILQSATINGARMNGCEDRLGQIKPGFIADLLLCRSNPLEDITILDNAEETIVLVMKDGRIEKSRRQDIVEESIPVRISPVV